MVESSRLERGRSRGLLRLRGGRLLRGLPRAADAAAEHATLAEVLDVEAIHMVRTMMTDDHKAAAQAFVQKAKPVFAGR
jgi:hypothetical protein